MTAGFPTIDFHAFHGDELPKLLASGHGALASLGTARLGSLAFRLTSGDAYTYVPIQDGIEIVEGACCTAARTGRSSTWPS